MKQDLLNLSTDLLRISYWIYDGRLDLANKFLSLCRKKYSKVNSRLGCYDNVWKEIDKIKKLEGGREKAAERASTASVILRQQALKMKLSQKT